MQRIVPFVLATWLLLPVGVAWSVDGVLEINQTCAVNTGCFPGDTAGFPVDVTTQGSSVRLTGSLTVPDANTTAIVVSAKDVTVDLNGFAIKGPTSCTGTPATCVTTGTGDGIRLTGAHHSAILNGTVRGFGNNGINGLSSLATSAREVRAESNGNIGIQVIYGGSVLRCDATKNGFDGISLGGTGNLVRESIAAENGGRGINLNDGSAIDNTVDRNGLDGIHAAHGFISGNMSTGNGQNGISLTNGGTASNNYVVGNDYNGINGGDAVIGNTANSNSRNGIRSGRTLINNSTSDNTDDGIRTVSGAATVIGNSSHSNGGFGLALNSETGYASNNVSNNTVGTVVSGIEIGMNVCNGSTTCP